MDKTRLYHKLTDIIAHGLLGVKKMLEQKPTDTFIPATKEDVVKAYQNEAMFHAQVKTMVAHIIYTIDEETHHLTSKSGQPDLICPVLFKERMESGENKPFLCPISGG